MHQYQFSITQFFSAYKSFHRKLAYSQVKGYFDSDLGSVEFTSQTERIIRKRRAYLFDL